LHAIIQALLASAAVPDVYVVSDVYNTKLVSRDRLFVGKSDDLSFVEYCTKKIRPDLVIIGPEEPLAAGVVDMLTAKGIPCVGPTKELAKLESSKAFTRALLANHDIPGNPEYRVFRTPDGIEEYLRERRDFVIKPDGLTGGKGVKVSGEHLMTVQEGVEYCAQLFRAREPAVVIEDKLDGEEFSLQSFFDGRHIAHTIPVQDHKRAKDGDRGPNTGGMGSYSCENHLLPFLKPEDIGAAQQINQRVGEALLDEVGEYKGILYGGFMVTNEGLRVIEYNARFGDPEVMNVLPIMETDFLEVCERVVAGTLNNVRVCFQNKATVCKYVVPESYPGKAETNAQIDIKAVDDMLASEKRLRVYYGAIEERDNGLFLTGSRAIAFVGIGDTLDEAERVAERAARLVKGPVYHRKDIGTQELIQKRMDHMHRVSKTPGQRQLTKVAS
jgi:phosphoribosylamine--glycine ligase